MCGGFINYRISWTTVGDRLYYYNAITQCGRTLLYTTIMKIYQRAWTVDFIRRS